MTEYVIETERLRLRQMTAADFDALFPILSDAETMRYYPAPFDAGKVRDWIDRNIARYQRDGFGLWAMILKENGDFVGDCGITMQNIQGRMLPEIGYHTDRRFQNRGLATEAAGACVRYAFEKTDFDAVYSCQKYTNLASRRVAEKIGMAFLTEYADPVNVKTSVYSISKADYRSSSNS